MAKTKKSKRVHGHSHREHCVVKRGKEECFGYDKKKVYGSAYAACYIVCMGERECEKVADTITKIVTKWVHTKRGVTSDQIAKIVAKELRKHNKHAAFMYETHRDVS